MKQLLETLQPLAPYLEEGKELTKQETLERIRPTLDLRRPVDRLLSQILGGLDFFSMIKDRSGRVIVS
jgi:hypothetical protein